MFCMRKEVKNLVYEWLEEQEITKKIGIRAVHILAPTET